MKKMFKYASLGAIALVGAVSFSACSSSDEIVDNPDYNPETNTVKAQLAISLQDNIANTRMSADATQAMGTVSKFLGMKNIKLIPYQTATVASSTAILTNTILVLNDIPSSSSGSATESNTVYTDVAVPVNTNRFLLYGSAGQTAGFENGNLSVAGLSSNTATNVSGVSFTPVSICSDVTTTSDYRIFKNILQLLNRVAGSSVTSGTTTETWAPGDHQTTVASLASLYTTFTSVTVGSSEYVKYLLEYLYNGVNSSASNESSPGNALAKKIQENILSALTYTDGGSSISCAENTFDTSNKTLTLATNYDGYPTNLNLPHGAIRIIFSEGKFVDGSSSNIGTFGAPSLDKYTYPANLQYFVESDILTSNDQVLNGTISTFATAQGLYGTSPGNSVSPSTRSILLNKQIQYGVGRLEASVNKLSGNKYFDRAGKAIEIPTQGYTLKGILIGDQKAVGWNFTRLESSSTYTIYDKKIAGTTGSAVTSTNNSETNHTLVLETVDDSPINVALEFVNNGSAFEGADGTVPAGATFYLIGKLTPSSSDTNYGEGSTKTKKVFAQDFVTKAYFTIGTGAKPENPDEFDQPDGFGEAVVGLPDLRQPQMELGLSVDLTWKPGLTFNINL